MRWPGVEPGSIAWKATMLTAIPPTLRMTPIVYFDTLTCASGRTSAVSTLTKD